jgi:hypothetical protein
MGKEMKFEFSILYLLVATFASGQSVASVYKCTDKNGKIAYQSSPCATAEKALKIDMKTGQSIDLAVRLKQKQDELELKKQRADERLKQQAAEAKRIADTIEQSALNQQLIKDNPIQYTAFAIPPYRYDRLPELVKPFESRLPEIEKFRRIAAQKALASGGCIRVESDQLSIKSQLEQLVFSIDCSTAKSYHYNETELLQQ